MTPQPTAPTPPTARANLLWGVRGGFAVALVYCAWVAIIYATSGAAPFTRQGVSFGRVVVAYLAIGIASGAAVGVLRPFASTRLGAYMVGLVAGVPVAVGIAVCVRGAPRNWDRADMTLLPIFIVAAAWVIGSELRKSV